MSCFLSSVLRLSVRQRGHTFKAVRWNRATLHSLAQTNPAMATVSPFTRIVVSAMRHLYPEPLADKSFDNTGLLLEAPLSAHTPRQSNSVLLTIDLTKAVAEEAIEENHSVVVAYHPIIFRGLKAITLDDSQQNSLLRLASHGITVYSPHTAVDIVPDGMADWLCDIVTGKVEPGPEGQAFSAKSETVHQLSKSSENGPDSSKEDAKESQDAHRSTGQNTSSLHDGTAPKRGVVHRTYSKPSYPSHSTVSPMRTEDNSTFYPSSIAHRRSIITPSPASAIDHANSLLQQAQDNSESSSFHYTSTNTGAGRLIVFDEPQPLAKLITRIANATGQPKGFPVAIPQYSPLENLRIRTVGVCPGSGSSVIRNCAPPPDLVFTGEMSHHEALAIIERGGCVITLFHSNSERGYLESVMRDKLEKDIKRRWRRARQDGEHSISDTKTKEILADDSVKVMLSQRDRDPFGIVVLQESQVEGEAI